MADYEEETGEEETSNNLGVRYVRCSYVMHLVSDLLVQDI
jgi:hypothetical protein